MTASRMRLSISSRPSSSISIMASAWLAISALMIPSALTCAKSRTQRSRLLAIRGVPRDLDATSVAPSGVISISRRPAERSMMTASSSLE